MTRRKRWYIKAIGSTSYDEFGLNFPAMISFDFGDLLKNINNSMIKWEKHNDWANQPTVATFWGTHAEAKQVNRLLPHGLLVTGYWENEN